MTLNQHSSTTVPFIVSDSHPFRADFASTTIGQTGLGASDAEQGIGGENNRNHYTFDIPVRMQYVRAIAVNVASSSDEVESGLGEGGVWMHILPKAGI